jgi:arsenate reductase
MGHTRDADMSPAPIRVLFVCTGNSARSQMAEALLEQLGGPDFLVESAGTEPRGVNPYTIGVLAELGIDWSTAESKSLDRFVDEDWDYVVTVCDRARQACPVFPGGRRSEHWDLADPAEVRGSDAERQAAFRVTATDLARRLPPFIEEALRAAERPPRSNVAG